MTNKHILILDDDKEFGSALVRNFRKKGYEADHVTSIQGCQDVLSKKNYDFIIVDLNLGNESGMDALPSIKAQAPNAKILILTGYASIATAVNAIKMGAFHYLTKPASAKDILAVLDSEEIKIPPLSQEVRIPETPTPLMMHEWEQIQATLEACDYNITETAKKLGIHRRTLQRKLQKRGYR